MWRCFGSICNGRHIQRVTPALGLIPRPRMALGCARPRMAVRRSGLRAKQMSLNRRLRRNVSGIGVGVAVERRFCIQGGRRRAWMVLPTLDIGGRACVAFSLNQGWLRNMVQGARTKSSHVGAIANLVNECVDKFRQAGPGSEPMKGGPGSEPMTEGPVPVRGSQAPKAAGQAANTGSSAGQQPLVPKKGKSAVLSDSDSGHESEQAPRKKQPRRLRRRGAKRGEFLTVEIRGQPVTYTVMSGPRIVVPVDGPWIQHLIEDLVPRAGEQDKMAGQASSQFCAKDLLTDADVGRIFWRASSVGSDPGWTIVLGGVDGRKRFKRAGLSVPRCGLNGDTLSDEGFLHNARQVLARARKLWNAEDMSGRDRIQL